MKRVRIYFSVSGEGDGIFDYNDYDLPDAIVRWCAHRNSPGNHRQEAHEKLAQALIALEPGVRYTDYLGDFWEVIQ